MNYTQKVLYIFQKVFKETFSLNFYQAIATPWDNIGPYRIYKNLADYTKNDLELTIQSMLFFDNISFSEIDNVNY